MTAEKQAISNIFNPAPERTAAEADQVVPLLPPDTNNLSDISRADLRILLAEDNRVYQKLALKVVKVFGYLADTAMNGHEAVDA